MCFNVGTLEQVKELTKLVFHVTQTIINLLINFVFHSTSQSLIHH